MPHHGRSAENGRVRIDDHPVLNRWVALLLAEGFGDAERAQRHSLVDLHILADHGCFADDDAGPMVDEEGTPDRRPGVDVDPRPLMRYLCQDAGEDRHAEK